MGREYVDGSGQAIQVEAAPGIKHDEGKLRFDLIPPEPLEDVVRVLMFGAKKYGPHNWHRVHDAKRRYLAAAFRHLWARLCGHAVDSESGLPHLAHAICCLMFVEEFDRDKTQKGKTLYLSGAITGKPNNNKELFKAAQQYFEQQGFNVINPLEVGLISNRKAWSDYMRDDLAELLKADMVCFLPGSENSTGVALEKHLCAALGIEEIAFEGGPL